MLKAYAGFARFKLATPDTTTLFQVGMQSPTMPLSLSVPFPQGAAAKTAFQCSVDAEGALEYDTIVYISNWSAVRIQVDVKITNAENGETVVSEPVYVDPWRMRTYSLAGALR